MAVTTSGKDKLVRHSRIYVGGYDLSGDALTFSNAENRYGEIDMHGWSESTMHYFHDNVRVIGLRGFQALMNDATAGAFTLLKATATQSRVSLCFGGGGVPGAGDPAYLLPSVQVSDQISIDASRAVITADFLPDVTQLGAVGDNNPTGIVLRGEAEGGLTATVAASSANSHDNGGATTGGWVANLHVLATSSGDYAFVVRHSTDDAAWATLGTFTADGSAITSEYLTGTGTVNQYVALQATRTAGTCTAYVTFARC
jgi:hypothetical protein